MTCLYGIDVTVNSLDVIEWWSVGEGKASAEVGLTLPTPGRRIKLL